MILRMWVLAPALLLSIGAASCSSAEHRPPERAVLSAFRREVAATRAAGLPVSVHDMARTPPPAASNAATYYVALARKRAADADWNAIQALYASAPAPGVVKRGLAVIAAHRADLNLVHRAVACDRCVLPHDWSAWPAENPPAVDMRGAARWIWAESCAEWFRGAHVPAVRTQALGFQVARHAAADRTLIGFLIACDVERSTLRGLRLLLGRAGDDPSVARAVREAAARCEPPGVASVLEEEVAGGLAGAGIDPDAPDWLYIRREWRLIHFGRKLRSAADLTATERAAWVDNLAQATAWVRVCRALAPLVDQPLPEVRARCREALGALGPSPGHTAEALSVRDTFVSAAAKRAGVLAMRETVAAGASVLTYRAAHGVLPSLLGQACAPVPLDPFDVKPLRYRLADDGFVVYSVGLSGRFDARSSDAFSKPLEAVFRWPLPPTSGSPRKAQE